ncbi:MAG: DUF2752 domain-containing protein [Acidimicrobiia bacterium]
MSTAWRDRLIFVGPIMGAIGLALFARGEDGPTVCPFALCTGMACPGCGLTRAAGSLLRGNLGSALDYHPLVPLLAAQIVVGWAWFILVRMGRARPPRPRTVTVILSVTLFALVTVWLLRLSTGSLPPV